MIKTVYIITKYHFYDTEWIVHISEDYEKANKCFNEYKNKLRNQNGLKFCEYQYDIDYEFWDDGIRTIKHIEKEDGCLKEWTDEGWRII